MKAIVLLSGCLVACARRESGGAAAISPDSAVVFVQRFYDWYVPLGKQPTSATRYDSLARNEHRWFSPDFVAALKNDLEVQRRDTTGDIVSVTGDYDPFLASQDPCERYQARDPRTVAAALLVSVFPVCAGNAPTSATVLVEVAAGDSGIRIVNFRNPGDPKSDLRRELAKTRRDLVHRHPD
jgi:hypothetical protein